MGPGANAQHSEQFPLDPDVPVQQSRQFPLDPEQQPPATKGRRKKVSMLPLQAAGTHNPDRMLLSHSSWLPGSLLPAVCCCSRLPLTECGPLQMTSVSEHLDNGTANGTGKGSGPQLSFRNWLPGKESVKVSCRLLYLPLKPNISLAANLQRGSSPMHRTCVHPQPTLCCPARVSASCHGRAAAVCIPAASRLSRTAFASFAHHTCTSRAVATPSSINSCYIYFRAVHTFCLWNGLQVHAQT